MGNTSIVIESFWDDEAGVWVATSTDIDDFVTEAATIDALEIKALAVISDLIELNGHARPPKPS